MIRQHPYKKYEGTAAWKILEDGISRLVENGDIREATPRHYIVGHLCQALVKSGLLVARPPPDRRGKAKRPSAQRPAP